LLLVLAVGLVGVVAPAHGITFPGENGRIAFNCGENVCTVNPDGSGTMSLGPGIRPIWSPDGNQIAFTALPPDGRTYLMNADGSGRRLADPPPAWLAAAEPGNPGVSPDGTRTLYRDGVRLLLHTSGGGEDLVIAVGRPDPAICEQDPEACSPFTGFTSIHGGTWAPDGSAFAYWMNSGSCGDLSCHELQSVWVANADGTDNLLVGWGLEPVWSPDSKLLTFLVSTSDIPGGGPKNLGVAARDGSAAHLVSASGNAGFPSWQPVVPPGGPQRGDYKNAARFCKAQRDFLGNVAFRDRYGANKNGANANGKCVGQSDP
jgi:Tol biopolymer transport system component